MQSTEPTLWQRRRSVFRWYLSQFSTVLHVILHTPFAAIAATALKIWWGLIEYFNRLLMWCTETTLFPHRQSAENAGPSLKQHWGSALPPSYMCDWAVRTDKAGRQDWESNYQHYIDIGPISFFFFSEIPLIEGDVKHPICTFWWLLTSDSDVKSRQTKNERNDKTVTMATNPLSTMRFHRSLSIFVIIFTRFSLISQSILNRF